MKIEAMKRDFVQSWSALGVQWGIGKSTAQVQALLLVSERDLTMDDVMIELHISRGNVHKALHTLCDWGLAYRMHHYGERKTYYKGEKDLWLITRRVADVRRRKEILPLLDMLGKLKQTANATEEEDAGVFLRKIDELYAYIDDINRAVDYLSRSAGNKTILKILKLLS